MKDPKAKATKDLCVYRRIAMTRDTVVINAVNAGISISKIHELTGIARTTIERIIERATFPDDDRIHFPPAD